MNVRRMGLLLAGLAVGLAAAPETTLDRATAGEGDAAWLAEVDSVEGSELSASELAVLRAQRDEVYGFAREMVDDHARSNREIAAMASSLGLGLPKRNADSGLEATPVPTFDKAYVRYQVKSHERAAELFERGARSANPRIQAFASRSLPIIRRHLDEARRLAGSPR